MPDAMGSQFFAHVRLLAQTSIGVWFAFWAWRKKYGSDDAVRGRSQVVRWLIVLAAYSLTFLPQPSLWWLRVGSFLIGLAFIAWPSLAETVVERLGRASKSSGLPE